MSTNSAIMRHGEGGGIGRYHHTDGYPSGVGDQLRSIYHHFQGDVDRMMEVLVDEHPAGWSNIWGDWGLAPGFIEHGSADGYDYSSDVSYQEWQEKARPQCYCHGHRSEEASSPIVCEDDPDRPGHCKAKNCDGLFIEWAYLISQAGIEVRKSVDTGKFEPENDRGYERPIYEHITLGTVAWDAPAEAMTLLENAYYANEDEDDEG